MLVKNPESHETIFERCKVMDHPILKEFPSGVRFYVDGTEIRCDIPSNSTRAQSSIFIVQALSYSQVPVIDPTAYPYLGISVSRHRIHIERLNCRIKNYAYIVDPSLDLATRSAAVFIVCMISNYRTPLTFAKE